MRKVATYLFISLDGVVQDPYKFQFAFDDVMGEAMTALTSEQDAILLGRVTYEEWADYWPNATEDLDFAEFINTTPKYVFSTTLNQDDLTWQNSTHVKEDLTTFINDLKQQPGGTIATAGSPTLVRSLVENELADELVLFVHPAIAGEGKRLFQDGSALQRLTLVDAKPTPSGVVILTYKPYTEGDTGTTENEA